MCLYPLNVSLFILNQLLYFIIFRVVIRRNIWAFLSKLCSIIHNLTVLLRLPESPLQYPVYSSVSMNSSQAICGGITAGLVSLRYKFVQSHSSCLLLYRTLSWKKKIKSLAKTMLLGCVFTAPLLSIFLSFLKSNIRVPVLECHFLCRDNVWPAGRPFRKYFFRTKELTPAYSYLPL